MAAAALIAVHDGSTPAEPVPGSRADADRRVMFGIRNPNRWPPVTLQLLPLIAVLCAPAPVPADLRSLEELFRSGESFEVFLGKATARRELWDTNWARAAVPEDLLRRARGVGGPWRFLVIAVDGCSDSVSTLPYLARLVGMVPALELRIVQPDNGGRALMESHRTPDGRAATPTVLLLDRDYREVGCFIERPSELQAWVLANPERLERDVLTARKMEWYAKDAGRQTLREVVEMLEAAAAGQRRCAANLEPPRSSVDSF